MFGYTEALKIDDQISELLAAEGVSPENRLEWMTFVRTLRTSLDLIDGEIATLPEVCPHCGSKKSM